MKYLISRNLRKLEKKERKFLRIRPSGKLRQKITPTIKKAESIMPDKLRQTLDTAFVKSFKAVFEKGTKYIEKTYDKDRIIIEYNLRDNLLLKKITKKSLKNLDRSSKRASMANKSISLLEGAGLGFLGIGLPDIPLFTAVLLKSIYEIALSYGFEYNTSGEQIYILRLIITCICKDDNRALYNYYLDDTAYRLDNNLDVEGDVDSLMETAASCLSDAVLAAKFIQGIPLIGAAGGAANLYIINKITALAAVKYKKRYLLKKIRQG